MSDIPVNDDENRDEFPMDPTKKLEERIKRTSAIAKEKYEVLYEILKISHEDTLANLKSHEGLMMAHEARMVAHEEEMVELKTTNQRIGALIC